MLQKLGKNRDKLKSVNGLLKWTKASHALDPENNVSTYTYYIV